MLFGFVRARSIEYSQYYCCNFRLDYALYNWSMFFVNKIITKIVINLYI